MKDPYLSSRCHSLRHIKKSDVFFFRHKTGQDTFSVRVLRTFKTGKSIPDFMKGLLWLLLIATTAVAQVDSVELLRKELEITESAEGRVDLLNKISHFYS